MARKNIKPISLEELKDDLKNRPGINIIPGTSSSPLVKPKTEKRIIYVARDNETTLLWGTNLFGYFTEPEKCVNGFWCGTGAMPLSAEAFPQIKATDEEPTRVLMTLEILDK